MSTTTPPGFDGVYVDQVGNGEQRNCGLQLDCTAPTLGVVSNIRESSLALDAGMVSSQHCRAVCRDHDSFEFFSHSSMKLSSSVKLSMALPPAHLRVLRASSWACALLASCLRE